MTDEDIVKIDDALTNLKFNIIGVNQVTKDLEKTWAEAASTSKLWTAASRILSGSGLWILQNRVRAVVDIWAVYNKMQIERTKREAESTKAMLEFSDLLTKQGEAADKHQEIMGRSMWGADVLDESLKREYQSYNLMLRKMGIDKASGKEKLKMQEAAQVMLQKEVDLTGILIKKEEKKMFGSKRAQARYAKRLQKSAGKVGEKKSFLEDMTMKVEGGIWNEVIKDIGKVTGPLLKFTHFMVGNFKKAFFGLKKGLKKLPGMIPKLLIGSFKFILTKPYELALKIWPFISNGYKLMETIGGFFLSIGKGIKGIFSLSFGGLKRLAKWNPEVWQKFQEKLKTKIIPNMAWFFRQAKAAMIYFILGLAAVFIVVKILKKFAGSIKEKWEEAREKGDGIFASLSLLKKSLIDFGQSIWDIISAIWSGDVNDFISSLFEFGHTSLKVIWNLLRVIWDGLLLTADILIDSLIDWVSTNGYGALVKLILGVGLVIIAYHIAASAIAYFATIVLGIIAAVPLGVVLLVAAFAVLLWAIVKRIPGMAGGGISPGGLTVVGERGPELVSLPRGARVHPNARMGNVINVNVTGRVGASDSEIRDISRKIGAQLNREINRSTSSATRM